MPAQVELRRRGGASSSSCTCVCLSRSPPHSEMKCCATVYIYTLTCPRHFELITRVYARGWRAALFARKRFIFAALLNVYDGEEREEGKQREICDDFIGKEMAGKGTFFCKGGDIDGRLSGGSCRGWRYCFVIFRERGARVVLSLIYTLYFSFSVRVVGALLSCG